MNTYGAHRYPFTPCPRGWYFLDTFEGFVKKKEAKYKVYGTELSLVKKDIERGFAKDKTPLALHNGILFAHLGTKEALFPINDVPLIDEFVNKEEWLPPFHLEFKARVHIQEVAENALDLAHFNRVHAYESEPELLHFSTKKHSFTVTLKAQRNILGFIDEPVMTITYYGMGIVLASVVSKPVEMKVLLTSTPIDEHEIAINHWISIRRQGFFRDKFYRALLPSHIYKDFAKDIPIWENKLYYQAPMLCPSEKDILRIRKWAQQFY